MIMQMMRMEIMTAVTLIIFLTMLADKDKNANTLTITV